MALETDDVSKLKRIQEAEKKLRGVARKKILSNEKAIARKTARNTKN